MLKGLSYIYIYIYIYIKSLSHQSILYQFLVFSPSLSLSLFALLLFFIFFFNMAGLLHQPCSVALCQEFHQESEDHWGKGGEYHYNLASSTSSFEDSSDLSDDDACSSTSHSSSQSNGALEDFTALFAQLPIKRGLSMFYEGKSQSFTSLSSVRSIEDLPKKRSPYSSRLSGCKSYAGGLDTHKSAAYTLPKPPTFKKASSKKISVSCPGYERQ